MSNKCILHAITDSSKMSFASFFPNGDGTFNFVHSNYNTTTTHVNMFAMDANGDKLSDVFQLSAYNSNTTSFITYLSQGGGVFNPISTEYPLMVGSYQHIFPMDIDGDGRQDILGARVTGGTLYLDSYFSQGDGSFKQLINYSTKDYYIIKLFPMDINNDGRQDIVQATYSTVGLLVLISYLSNGDGTFESVKNYYSVDDNIFYMAPLNINDDTYMDIVHMTSMGSSTTLMGFTSYLSHGDGTFKQIYNVYEGNGAAISYSYAAEAGAQAVFTMSSGYTDTNILEDIKIYNGKDYDYQFLSYVSQGNGEFKLVNTSYISHSVQGEVILDANGDGRSDIVQTGSSGGYMEFYTFLANSDGSFDGPISSVYTPELDCVSSKCVIFPMDFC